MSMLRVCRSCFERNAESLSSAHGNRFSSLCAWSTRSLLSVLKYHTLLWTREVKQTVRCYNILSEKLSRSMRSFPSPITTCSRLLQHRYISNTSILYSSSKVEGNSIVESASSYKRWTKEEDAKLMELAQMANKLQTWKGLPLLKGRTIHACSERARYLQKRQHGIENATVVRSQQLWTSHDKQLIVDLVAALNRAAIPWTYIQPRFFPNRTLESLCSCWYKTIKPSIEKGERKPSSAFSQEILDFVDTQKTKSQKMSTIWSGEEDECLIAAVKKHGQDWKLIADTAFTSIDYEGDKTLKHKSVKQCSNRWAHLNPELSREAWSEYEQSRLRELVSQCYKEHDPTLDVDAIINHKASWPAGVTLPFTMISEELAKEGIKRSPNRCSSEWFNRTDPSIRGGEWSEDEINAMTEIMRKGGTYREVWRQLHRSASSCSTLYRRICGEFEQGPLSNKEQVIFITALYAIGKFHNRTIRADYLPRRLSNDIMHYWRDHEQRIQKTVFDYSKADIATRREYGGKNNNKFFTYFSSLELKEKDFQAIVYQLQQFVRVKS